MGIERSEEQIAEALCQARKNSEEHWNVFVENLIGVVVGTKSLIVGGRMMEEQMFDEAINEIRKWKQRPDATIWFAMAWAEG